MTEGGAGSESLPLDPAAGSRLTHSRASPGIMGGMAEADSMRRGSPTSPSGSGRLPTPRRGADRDRGSQILVRVSHEYLRPARGGGAVSARRGRPRRLLIPRRGHRAPGELPRPEQNPTEASHVDSLIDFGG